MAIAKRKVWKRLSYGLALVLLACSVSGCATLRPGPLRENFGPLFIYSEDEEGEGTRIDVLGPLFTYQKNEERQDMALRPFFYREEMGQYSLLEYAYPFGQSKKTPQAIDSYLMPFYRTHRDLTLGKQPTERNFLLAFWGKTEEGEPYGGFFPIYGNLKKRFGRDEINFFLWPVYSDSREGESKNYTFFWPFLTYSRGGGKTGYRFWPLAGYERKENEYEKTFFLWPFFDFEKRHLDMEDPTAINMFWPFYVSSTRFSGKRTVKSVLWPFFTYAHDEDEKYTQWDFPWPLLQWAWSEGEKSIFRFRPLYSRKTWDGTRQGYILLGLYSYSRLDDELFTQSVDRYLFFSKFERSVWNKENRQDRRVRIWPFFYYREAKDGSLQFYSPVIIPADLEGIERNWNPLFALYEYRRNVRGASESKFLWGLYVHRKSKIRELTELSFLFTRYKAENVSYVSILRGLMEYRIDEANRKLRLFYSPWPIEWEKPAVPVSTGTRSGKNGVEDGAAEK